MNIYNNQLYRKAKNSIRSNIAKNGGIEGYIATEAKARFWGYICIAILIAFITYAIGHSIAAAYFY